MIERLLNSELLVRLLDRAVWWAEDFRDAHPRLWDAIWAAVTVAALLAAFHLEWATGHPAHY